MLEALQLLKSAYRNCHISATEDARKWAVKALDCVDSNVNTDVEFSLLVYGRKKLRFVEGRTGSEVEPNPFWTGPMSGPGFAFFGRTGPQVRFGVRTSATLSGGQTAERRLLWEANERPSEIEPMLHMVSPQPNKSFNFLVIDKHSRWRRRALVQRTIWTFSLVLFLRFAVESISNFGLDLLGYLA
jgi:hypothetical protein